MKRRKFINNLLIGSAGLSSLNFAYSNFRNYLNFPYKLSLAQWSFNRYIFSGNYNPYSFAKSAYELGFEGLEYLAVAYKNDLFNSSLSKKKFGLKEVKEIASKSLSKSNEFGLKNLLIMVDGEGNLANKDRKFNDISVDNHKIWIDCAHEMGCHSVRVNLDSDGSFEDWKNNSIISLNKLCEYANPLGLNIIVENHSTFSNNGLSYAANADYIIEVIENIDFKNIGTLPDFGNFCLKFGSKNSISTVVEGLDSNEVKIPSYYDNCELRYNMYEGIRKLLPYAKGLSAKTHGFDENGNDINIDYVKMLQILKDFGYSGFIGVEQEVYGLDPIESIQLTKNLIFKSWNKLS